MYEFNPHKTTAECIEWVRGYFDENGKDSPAVIGISGGKDSTITAAILVRALGPERVVAVMMPNGEQPDISTSYFVCGFLGISRFLTVNVADAFASIRGQVEPAFGWSEQSDVNLSPRLRMSVLYAVAQSVNGRVANTCNLSEDWIGYSTLYGDLAGDFAPLRNLTVEEVKRMGIEALDLPEHLVEKPPADGLCGKTDEENIGFSYRELDDYLRRGIAPSDEARERIERMHEQSQFKRDIVSIPAYDPMIPITA